MVKDDLINAQFRITVLAGFQIFWVLLLLNVLLAPKHYVRLKFYLPSENADFRFSKRYLEKNLEHKLIVPFFLTGSFEKDDKILDTIDLQTKFLNISNDTMQVLQVHFSTKNTYGQFVQMVNIMQIEMSERYALFDDDFYIFANPKEETTQQNDSTKVIAPIYL